LRPAAACQDCHGANDQCSRKNLRASDPENRPAQSPKQSGAKFEPDEEQHHDNSELCEMHHVA
jgi:hypothetical protein